MAESKKRLQFLISLMETKGISKPELAAIMGKSRQNIFTYFKRDDMKLSFAQEIAKRLGYNLSFSLESENPAKNNMIVEIEKLVGNESLKRLAFLRLAMSQYGIERKAIAEQLGLNYVGVSRWFMVDDIALSYIFEIAELYGLNVKIKAQVIENAPSEIKL